MCDEAATIPDKLVTTFRKWLQKHHSTALQQFLGLYTLGPISDEQEWTPTYNVSPTIRECHQRNGIGKQATIQASWKQKKLTIDNLAKAAQQKLAGAPDSSTKRKGATHSTEATRDNAPGDKDEETKDPQKRQAKNSPTSQATKKKPRATTSHSFASA